MSHFVEYDLGKFFVAVYSGEYFYVINRDKNAKPQVEQIVSFNPQYWAMGIQMLPKWETTFAVVRDDRGV